MINKLISLIKSKYTSYRINKMLKLLPGIDMDGDIIWHGNKKYYIHCLDNVLTEVKDK